MIARFSEQTVTSAHIHRWETDGELTDLSYFCSDYCHRQFLRMRGIRYDGWDGCHEVSAPCWCDNCGAEF